MAKGQHAVYLARLLTTDLSFLLLRLASYLACRVFAALHLESRCLRAGFRVSDSLMAFSLLLLVALSRLHFK